MEPETREWFSLIVDEVKEYEGLQKTAKVGRRHQARDGSVTLSAGPSGDAGKGFDGCVVRVAVLSWDLMLDMGLPFLVHC